MSTTVLLRAKSGPSVGMGHVMRTRAIAQALRELGVHHLFCVDDERSLAQLRTEGFEAELLTPALVASPPTCTSAWIDDYEDCSPWLRALRAQGTAVLLVENRTTARNRATCLLYPTLHHRADAWDRQHAERVLAGAEWIPIASTWQAESPPVEREHDLLITFGGSDPKRLSERALTLLPAHIGRVVVTLGAHMLERRGDIARAGAHIPGLQLLAGSSDLLPWMAASRLALTALGTTLYELAFVGTPALILANYSHDEEALAVYAERGPHHPLGIAAELDDEQLRRRLVDGIERLRSRSLTPDSAIGGGARRLALLLRDGVPTS